MGWCAVEVIIEFLDVFPMITLGISHSKQSLLEDRVAAVPQSERQAPIQVLVAEPTNPVLAPAIGAAARMIVREIFPGSAIFAVILANSAPLALAEVRPPTPPVLAVPYLFEALALGSAKCAGPIA